MRARTWTILIVLLAGCSQPIVKCKHPQHTIVPKAPKDRIGDILNLDNVPKWLIESYAEWVRYAYDLR